jgi:hypothetical protein
MNGFTRAGRGLALLSFAAALAACAAPQQSPAWLSRGRHEQQLQLERQLRGLDVAMLEVGHRYAELYWASGDANWEAAAYQLQKIRLAIELGLERRPQRAPSARAFLAGPLASLDATVAARDAASFAERFRELTAGCNSCHATERVAFFEVHPPALRTSPVQHVGAGRED